MGTLFPGLGRERLLFDDGVDDGEGRFDAGGLFEEENRAPLNPEKVLALLQKVNAWAVTLPARP